jgi:ElaB/YqjD/DUF883 family membrane-anchored ribosome-binding protein
MRAEIQWSRLWSNFLECRVMTARPSIREELEKLRRDLESIGGAEPARAPADAPTPDQTWLTSHLKELHSLVQQTLDEAEDTVAEHPRAAIAGALALGIVIGRLTVR